MPLTTLATQNEQTGVSPITVTANGESRVYGEFACYEDAVLTAYVSAVSGTNPTLKLELHGYDETANQWHKVAEFPEITATGKAEPVTVDLHFIEYKLVWIVGGTSPSFTFSCQAIARAR